MGWLVARAVNSVKTVVLCLSPRKSAGRCIAT